MDLGARWALMAVLCGAGGVACRSQPSPDGSAAPGEAEETESPSARILPEPLPETGAEGADELVSETRSSPKVAEVNVPREPLPLVGELRAEAPVSGVVSGMVLLGTFAWPPARGVVQGHGGAEPAWPTLQVELQPAFRDQPGRIRLVLTSRVWGLPQGTELRGRSDAEGFIAVWPDQRSYRVVAQGALRALFEERRVDRMPLVPVELSELGAGKRVGRATRKVRAEGAVGALRLDLAQVPESGSESSLLCDFFFGLIRAQTPDGICRRGELPLFVDLEASEGGSLQFSVSEMEVRPDLLRSNFLMPPELGIYKPGELPPTQNSLWPPNLLAELAFQRGDGQAVHFKNHHDVPLFLLLDSVPVSRIDPGGEVVFQWGAGEHRHAARDFLGQIMEPGGVVQAPGEVQYGKPSIEEDPL